MDPNCLKVTKKHFKAMSLHADNHEFQGKSESPCLYHVVYEDQSYSDGVIVKENIQMRITNLVTGVGVVHLSEAYLG